MICCRLDTTVANLLAQDDANGVGFNEGRVTDIYYPDFDKLASFSSWQKNKSERIEAGVLGQNCRNPLSGLLELSVLYLFKLLLPECKQNPKSGRFYLVHKSWFGYKVFRAKP
jgi:hypothetical protein